MGCPNMAIREVPLCYTLDKPYNPSVYQFREYCSRKRHYVCPFFRGFRNSVSDVQSGAACIGGERSIR